MKIGPEIKPALLGAAGGAVVLAIVGFAWGGWVTGATAREQAEKNADTAVVSVLSPICAIQFNAQPDSAAKLAELTALSSYQQPKFIEEGGWAVMPGAEDAVSGVSRGCAAILTTET
ncbi:hypothetical protein [Bauldia litoralis]|uniref:hypothetical protein n=1 Tax=Bauldia litoralis TaxID=665467 RepID=UPI003263C837